MSLAKEIIIENIDWSESYYDLYPGFSKDTPDDNDEVMFDSKEQADVYVDEIKLILDPLYASSKIKLYRSIFVEEYDKINYEYLGNSWSFEEFSAIEFGRHNGSNVLLVTETTPSNIDWEETIKTYTQFSSLTSGESENELVVINDFEPELTILEVRPMNKKKKTTQLGQQLHCIAQKVATFMYQRCPPVDAMENFVGGESREQIKKLYQESPDSEPLRENLHLDTKWDNENSGPIPHEYPDMSSDFQFKK